MPDSQGDGIHYAVGHPLLGDGIPFLPASVKDKNGAKRPQMLPTPEEEVAGELRHATGA